MTHTITVDNVNTALSDGLWWLKTCGVEEDSRNGKVLVSPGPVVTEYLNPCERVLFSPMRAANPFFHLMEALWMMAGKNDLAWPKFFNSRFNEYSDDQKTLHGAYGYRWRKWFGIDQIRLLILQLQNNKESRRAVMGMWDPLHDLGGEGKDLPCNTHIYFDCRGDKLNMTVCCRSNDILWGAYGANVVHMSVLQEVLAAAIDIPVGVYRQFSNNYHLYTDILPKEDIARLAQDAGSYNLYRGGMLLPYKMVTSTYEQWMNDLEIFLTDPGGAVWYADSFFNEVAVPMYMAWHHHKKKDYVFALEHCDMIRAPDWKFVATQWMKRKADAARNA